MSQANEILKSYLKCHQDNVLVPIFEKFKTTDNLLRAPLESMESAKNELRHSESEYFTTLVQNAALFENRNRHMRMFLPAIFLNEVHGLENDKFNNIFGIILEAADEDLSTMINRIGENYRSIPESEWLKTAENDYICAYVSNMVWIKLFHYITTEPEIFSSFKNIFMNYRPGTEETLITFGDVSNEWANYLLQHWQWVDKKRSA